jgi:hypothetical protein
MKITPEQRAKIDSLSCERLSSNDVNFRLVDEFFNIRNSSISDTLQNEAYQEDETGKVAYYVVKNQEGQLLFYFSLKCGMLYDSFIDDHSLKLLNKLMTYLDDISTKEQLTQEETMIVDKFREKLRSHKGLTKKEIEQIPKKGGTILEDLEKEIGENVTHVGSTFSGIELVHFCANENTRDFWKESVEGQKLGVVVFWEFVVKEVLEAMKHVGCQYLFLFAADKTDDEELVAYYRDSLFFKEAVDVATAKPIYDLTCKFMYQETSKLVSEQSYFFDHYNIDSDEA